MSENTWSIEEGFVDDYFAFGVYSRQRYSNGWDSFQVQTNPNQTDYQQAFAAGYLEGALTQSAIWDYWKIFWNANMHFEHRTSLISITYC